MEQTRAGNTESTKSDERLCEQGIAALLALYGYCDAADYTPECPCCRASVLIKEMRAMVAEGTNV